MINLCPQEYKNNIKYARYNTTILKWLGGIIAIITILISTVLAGQLYLLSETNKYASLNSAIEQQLKDKDLDGTLKTIEAISGNLKLIVQVLSKQVVFSELIKQVGAVMPENTVLSDIEISKVDGGIDLTADAKDHATATQIQINLADPNNKLFEKVDLVSINCDGTNPQYPCKATLRALFAKNTPFTAYGQNKQKVNQ